MTPSMHRQMSRRNPPGMGMIMTAAELVGPHWTPTLTDSPAGFTLNEDTVPDDARVLVLGPHFVDPHDHVEFYLVFVLGRIGWM